MKFPFETMRFLSKYMTLNQQITYLMTFHTYFTVFQTAAPRRITNKISQIANPQQFGLFFLLLSSYGTCVNMAHGNKPAHGKRRSVVVLSVRSYDSLPPRRFLLALKC